MANVTNTQKIEAIMMALENKMTLQESLKEVVSSTSNAPGGVTIDKEDVPKITRDHVKMMISLSRTLDGIVDNAVKNSDKETGDEKKSNKKIITGAKRMVKKLKPMTMTPKKLGETIDDLKKHLDVK